MVHDRNVVSKEIFIMVINFSTDLSKIRQKKIEAVLVKQRLWPQKNIELVYVKLKSTTSQPPIICDICI